MAHSARELEKLGADLKAMGDKKLRLKLARGLRAPGKNIIRDAKNNTSRLPTNNDNGGLAEWVRNSKWSTSVQWKGKKAGVRVRGRKRDSGMVHDLEAIDKGLVRHHLPNNRDVWFRQSVPARFWTDACEANTAAASAAVDLVITQTIDEFVAKGGI